MTASNAQRNDFIKSESTFSQTMSASYELLPVIVELFVDESLKLPFHLRTGQQCLGDVSERKRFRYVEFHGTGQNPGTISVRIYIDGKFVCSGVATLSESSNKHRMVNIPIARQSGYAIDIECAGSASLRAIEFTHDELPSQS